MRYSPAFLLDNTLYLNANRNKQAISVPPIHGPLLSAVTRSGANFPSDVIFITVGFLLSCVCC